MREFRPPVRPSKVRSILSIALPLLVALPLIVLGLLIFSPMMISYTISGGALTIRTGEPTSSGRTVQLADITEARAVTLQRGRRTRGTGMPGYCTGHFSYPDLGAVWQATNCGARAVIVRATGQERPIIISPPDRDGFLEKLRSGAETSISLPPPDKGFLYIIGGVLLPLALVSAVMVSVLLRIGPGRMRYLVGDKALEAHTVFGRKRWLLEGARARPYTPGRMWRLAGTAVPGYFTGVYREDGQTTRVYATDTQRAVLIEGPARVILSPEDQEGFLRALEEEGVAIGR